MRPRQVLALLLLAALPIVLAVALTGGGGRVAGPRMIVQVSLQFRAGTGKATLAACGSIHHYVLYRAGMRIRFRGTVSRAGAWSVQLKLKACAAGVFEPAGDVTATHQQEQLYHGEFAAPTAGYYFGRVELREGGAVIARSRKRYFRVS
ncbi:MAG: hypothetical protein ACYC91_11960 [Solirubrobacteraceae bacterium]